MWEVVVGVLLTALIGGVAVPTYMAHNDRRRERINLSSELLETLAASLWTYWKLAMRVAYYGSKADPKSVDYYTDALKVWNSDEAWDNGAQIQIQISRSKRVLPEHTMALDRAQQAVVDELDTAVERLRKRGDTSEWTRFYEFLYGTRREWIHELLSLLTQHLAFAQQAWFTRRWRTRKGEVPAPISDLDRKFVAFAYGDAAGNPNGDANDSVEGS